MRRSEALVVRRERFVEALQFGKGDATIGERLHLAGT